MVVFTCNHCGDSLQKPRVEKHYSFVCRVEKNLTCVDCFKDFRGEEYAIHTQCITEDERYAAKGTYINGIVKKGQVKQESWVEMINSILDKEEKLKPSCRNLLNNISSFSNIPRKKPKFVNFIKSSFGGRINMRDIEDVWNIIEQYKKDTKNSNMNNSIAESKEENGNEEKDVKNKENETKKRKNIEESEDFPKKKKHKKEQVIDDIVKDQNESVQSTKDNPKKKKKQNDADTTADLQQEETIEENNTFNFTEKILAIVSSKGSISLKKLQKKVLNAYIKAMGESEVTPKAIKKFNKKLKKIPNVEIDNEKVTLLQEN